MLDWLSRYQLPCLFREIWGIECPGCGAQRSLYLLMQGAWKESFYSWPPLVTLLFFLILIGMKVLGMKKISVGLLKSAGFACLIIILISYLLKLFVNNH